MASASEKVRPLGQPRTVETEMHSSMQDEIMSRSHKDMGKAAMFISILAVVLMVVFFFGINQNITGMSAELKQLSSVQTDVLLLKNQFGGLEGQVGTINSKIVELEKLPLQTKQMLVSSMLQEMAQRTNYLSTQVDSDQAAKLQQAMDLLNQVQGQMPR